MRAYVIGVDSGTQSTKVVIVETESGRIVGRGRAPHALVSDLPRGAVEQDPAVWISALKIALKDALTEAALPDLKRIVALGISGQQHGFVPLDERGRVIRPAKLWCDTSTISEAEEIVRALGGPEAVLDKTGMPVAVGFTASKILWLKKHEPDRYARLRTVLLPHNYLNYVLTGRACMEYGDASGTGLMDVRRRTWSREAAEAIDPALPGYLPELRPPSEPTGVLGDEFAAEFGLAKVLVASGGGDNMMGAVGTGNVRPGVCTISLGTSGTVYSYASAPLIDPRGEIAGFCDSTGGWLPLLCTMNVTNATEAWKDLLKLDDAERDEIAARAPAGSDGLIFLPFLEGERVPVLPDACAVFFGLNRKTFEPSRMTRSVMEGTLLNLGYGLGRLRDLGLAPAEIRATGGGSRSAFWLQIVADLFQIPVMTLEETEAAALGAAIQAIWNWRNDRGESVALSTLTDALVRTSRPAVQPDLKNREVYASRQARFNSLWRTLVPEFRA
ncbi:MAG: xylulokinase [Candidatus Aminicenantales bacterium]